LKQRNFIHVEIVQDAQKLAAKTEMQEGAQNSTTKKQKTPNHTTQGGKKQNKKKTPTAEKPDAYSRLEHRCKQQDQQQHTTAGHQ